MKKISILTLIATLAIVLVAITQPVAAQSSADAEIDRLLRKMLEDSRQELQRSLAETGKTNRMVESLPRVPDITVYKPYDVSKPRPPIGNFNSLNSPGVFGPTRPSCMPYYEGCWRVR